MKQELIVCIVNSGFSDMVMNAARDGGARGGTILNARGAARAEAEKKYSISIHEDKDLVLVVADEESKEEILHNLYNKIGLHTDAMGFVFTLPVDESVGFRNVHVEEKDIEDKEED